DASRMFPDPWAASMDCIVPLSQGGRYELSNVRLAHYRCNTRRRNRPMLAGHWVNAPDINEPYLPAQIERTSPTDADVVALRRAGLTFEEIGNEVGLRSVSEVSRRLRRHGAGGRMP